MHMGKTRTKISFIKLGVVALSVACLLCKPVHRSSLASGSFFHEFFSPSSTDYRRARLSVRARLDEQFFFGKDQLSQKV